ncbi:hypothetical protein [Oceanobacillus bengalensis]|uniref:Uncharacterized protein n=1 Tax=Oceanobacillus bengalensis TaxID=1435466 RepID=A0A494Z6Q0_9BACI|nr:hypothetical protein [Oceanobacillus bengalensis]RKQ17975.1 hypothetical protein D8M05_03565 [Oceanobacillus bengalensis]
MPILNEAIKNEIEQNPHEMNLISLLKIKIEQNSLQMNLISSLKIKIKQNSLQMNLISLLKIEIEQNPLQMNLISSLKKIPQIIVTSQFISTARKSNQIYIKLQKQDAQSKD